MKSESKPRSSTVRANVRMPRARSGPSPSQMYEGRKTPNRPISLICRRPSLQSASAAPVLGIALSKKAFAPSSMSSLPKMRSDASSSAARPASRSTSIAASISRFASRTASGPRAAISSADRRGARDGLAGRHDLVHETDPRRFVGGEDPAGQDQLPGPGRADDARQPLRAAGSRG